MEEWHLLSQQHCFLPHSEFFPWRIPLLFKYWPSLILYSLWDLRQGIMTRVSVWNEPKLVMVERKAKSYFASFIGVDGLCIETDSMAPRCTYPRTDMVTHKSLLLCFLMDLFFSGLIWLIGKGILCHTRGKHIEQLLVWIQSLGKRQHVQTHPAVCNEGWSPGTVGRRN